MDSAWIEEILRQPGSVLLCGAGTWMDDADAIVLHEPEHVAAIHTPGEVADFVGAIEAAQQRGRYVISSLSYEAGAAYGLPNHPPLSDRPLGWMAAYNPGSMVTLTAASLPEVRGDFDASDVVISTARSMSPSYSRRATCGPNTSSWVHRRSSSGSSTNTRQPASSATRSISPRGQR
ncbi:MAG: hypothetical protein R6V19_02720 [Armatimonadota bacterium]